MNNKNNNHKYPYKRGRSWRKRTVEKDVRRNSKLSVAKHLNEHSECERKGNI